MYNLKPVLKPVGLWLRSECIGAMVCAFQTTKDHRPKVWLLTKDNLPRQAWGFPPAENFNAGTLSQTEQSQETQSDANLFSCLFTCMSNLSVGYWRLLSIPRQSPSVSQISRHTSGTRNSCQILISPVFSVAPKLQPYKTCTLDKKSVLVSIILNPARI